VIRERQNLVRADQTLAWLHPRKRAEWVIPFLHRKSVEGSVAGGRFPRLEKLNAWCLIQASAPIPAEDGPIVGMPEQTHESEVPGLAFEAVAECMGPH
jgi:hypothetical protein